jgi:hypothetical protein
VRRPRCSKRNSTGSRGEMTLLKDPRSEAEAKHCLRQAIDVASFQKGFLDVTERNSKSCPL